MREWNNATAGEILDRIAQVIREDPDSWIQHVRARTAGGQPCSATNPLARSRCLSGFLDWLEPGATPGEINRARWAIEYAGTPAGSRFLWTLTAVNDSLENHEEALELVERARARLEERT